MKLYENIKQRRLALGLTQAELAKLVGYADKSVISRIENGNVNLKQSKIAEFAKVLRTTPPELMGYEEEEIETTPLMQAIGELVEIAETCTVEQVIDAKEYLIFKKSKGGDK